VLSVSSPSVFLIASFVPNDSCKLLLRSGFWCDVAQTVCPVSLIILHNARDSCEESKLFRHAVLILFIPTPLIVLVLFMTR
jgi:hypothetical protein